MSGLDTAATALALWRKNPVAMVETLFGVKPDHWQREVLEQFPHRPLQAMKACKGPGKTAILAWLAWNFLLTRPHPKIAATSITADNLRDNLWPEMAKWQTKSRLLQETFTWAKERIYSNDHPETWFMSARTWPKSADPTQQANTLAGLHADYIMFILDESGGIPSAVMATAEAGLSSCIEGHILQAGNPTHLDGPLYAACTTQKDRWHVVEISGDPDDPKRSTRVSVEWAREQIKAYGRDNPWVLVNVFGRFPPSSLNSLIGPDEVNAAMQRNYREDEYDFAAKIIGADVARQGDDSSVIFKRQGLVAFVPDVLRNVKADQGAGRVANIWNEWEADAAMIDGTGGYGAGWIDFLRTLGKTPFEVQFAGSPDDARFANKRAEIWWKMVEWIKSGGALPNVPDLVGELTVPTYTFKGDKILIEAKEQIKLRLGRSPDYADALACTFAYPITSRRRRTMAGGLTPYVQRPTILPDYDPFSQAGD